MATVTPLRRIEFASSDPSEIRDFLHRVRGSRMLLNGTRDRSWWVSLTQIDTGEFRSSEMWLPADITFRMRGRDEVVIDTILGGTIGLDHGKASHRYRLGDVYVASCPRADFTCHTHEVRSHTITLPQPLLTEVTSITPDHPGAPWSSCPSCRSPAPPGGGGRSPASWTACWPSLPPRTPRWSSDPPPACSPPPP